MSSIENGGPAFPAQPQRFQIDEGGAPRPLGHDGMSLRDYFAGQALAGIMSGPDEPLPIDPGEATADAIKRYWKETAGLAYLIADAMLKAREDAQAAREGAL